MENSPALAPPAQMTYANSADLETLRSFVCGYADSAGLGEMKAGLLALAVTELATNTLQYSGGTGHVLIWAEAGAVVCEVQDTGPLSARPLDQPMPAPTAARGRGLAIVRTVCDSVTARDTPTGTTIHLTMNL
jgi:serine/threonine-protein kinase RsbW